MKILAALAFAGSAFAGTLTFPGGNTCSSQANGLGGTVGCGNGSYIHQSLGDTADLDVTYVDMNTNGNTLYWWDKDYNNLVGVVWAGGGDSNSYGRVELKPLGGAELFLVSFDLGAYFRTTRNSQGIRILELGTNSVLKDFGTQLIGTGNLAVTFNGNVSSKKGVAIEWKNSAYNNGIDNIVYSFGPGNVGNVPEPTTLSLVGGSILALGALRLRRR